MRSRNSSLLVGAISLLGIFALLARGQETAPAQWGTIKGQVVWTDKVIPKNPPILILPPGPCLANGPVLQNKLVINPKNKGVRWVLVWLADPKDAANAKFVPPIHPSLTNPPPGTEIDSPCCEFRPRVIGLWTKQNLVVRNSSPIVHSILMRSVGGGPIVNRLILPKGQITIKGFVPKLIPTIYSCGVHRWMKGYIGTFAHPYFAVTDADGKFEIANAPVGKFQLILWHEEVGFLTQPNLRNRKVRGKVVEIKVKGVTDVGKIGMKQPEDD